MVAYNGHNALECDLPTSLQVVNGTVKVGDAVSAEFDGVICEGNVHALLPWNTPVLGRKRKSHGKRIGTVVIRDHADGHYGNWDVNLVHKV